MVDFLGKGCYYNPRAAKRRTPFPKKREENCLKMSKNIEKQKNIKNLKKPVDKPGKICYPIKAVRER